MVGSIGVQGQKKRPRRVRDIFRRWPFKLNMHRLPARTRSYVLPSTMADPQSLPLLGREHLATARSCQRNKQEPLITVRRIVPRFSHRPLCPPNIQRITLLARTGQRRIIRSQVVRLRHGRTIGNQVVRLRQGRTIGPIIRRRPSRITGLSPTGMSLRSDNKALPPTSVRNPYAPLLRKRGLHRSNSSARSPPLRSRKRRSIRTNNRSRTRSHHSNGKLQTGLNPSGIPLIFRGCPFSFQRTPCPIAVQFLECRACAGVTQGEVRAAIAGEDDRSHIVEHPRFCCSEPFCTEFRHQKDESIGGWHKEGRGVLVFRSQEE